MGQDLLSSYGWGNKHPPSSILGYLGTRLLTHNHITISSLDWWGINFYLSLYSYKSYYLSVISIESLYRYIYIHMAVCQILVPLVNIKIAGKWMFIPLKMVLIGIDPYPYIYMIYDIQIMVLTSPCFTPRSRPSGRRSFPTFRPTFRLTIAWELSISSGGFVYWDMVYKNPRTWYSKI